MAAGAPGAFTVWRCSVTSFSTSRAGVLERTALLASGTDAGMDAHVARRAGYRAHGPRRSRRGRAGGAVSTDRLTLLAVGGAARPAGPPRRRARHRLPQRPSRPGDHGAER